MVELTNVLPRLEPFTLSLRSDLARKITLIHFAAVYALLALHFPIQHFTGLELHWVALLTFVPIAVIQAKASHNSAVAFGAYLILIALSAALSLRLLSLHDVALGSLSYLLLPVAFFLGLQFDTLNRVRAIASVNVCIALLAGLAAYFQLNFDKLLFGLYDGTSYEDLESWGTARSASFFYSPQVYAAFMVFSVILHDCVFRADKRFPGVAAAAISAFAMLAGSMSVVGGIAGYYLIKLMFRRLRFIRIVTPTVTGLAVAFAVGGLIYQIIKPPERERLIPVVENSVSAAPALPADVPVMQARPAERIVSMVTGNGTAVGANADRLEIWKDIITETPLLGRGIGSASTLVDGRDRVATESYVLSLYYQGGVVLVAAFAVLFGALFTRRIGPERLAFAAVLALIAMIVPVYYAWALPVVWVLLFGFIELDDFSPAG